VLAGEVNWYAVSGDGSRLVLRDGGDLRVVPADRKADSESSDEIVSVDLTRARYLADPAALWAHAYEEAGRILRRDFWTPGMSDVDWDGVLDEYRFLLARIGSAAEFTDLLWEVVAELGTSHAYVTGSGAFASRSNTARDGAAALLGADVVRSPDGRWLVERVLPGESSDPRARSPLAAPGVAIRAGDEIVEVDGRAVDPVHGPWPLLAGTAGKPVELTVLPADPSAVPLDPKAQTGMFASADPLAPSDTPDASAPAPAPTAPAPRTPAAPSTTVDLGTPADLSTPTDTGTPDDPSTT